jgi:uncharacterized protein
VSIVVSDTSSLRALHHLQQMSLLVRFYGEVWIPPTVMDELEAVYGDFGRLLAGPYAFLKLRVPANKPQLDKLLLTLDQGEAEAIALAVEVHADLLLMDERAGRATAKRLGLTVTGVLGILSRAKREGMLLEIRPLLDELECGLGFFIGETLKKETLKALGE